jgi:1-deoxy-D-xylulose-5-phosphate reductoisomerase
MKTLTILGATGSVGASTLNLIGQKPEAYQLAAVVGGANVEKLASIAIQHQARYAAIADAALYNDLKQALSGTNIIPLAGQAGVLEAASMPCDISIAAITGAAGILPTAAALQHAKTVAIANKEALVCAAPQLLALAKAHNTNILPIDSEHNAIYQLLAGQRQVQSITLTASGGAFRDMPLEELAFVTPAMAFNHPVWPMGAKISVDSATMMNKGLEVIEACYLFNLPQQQVHVLLHPQALVHGMITFEDGTLFLQAATPHMASPISYALAYPERWINAVPLAMLQTLEFLPIDDTRYPSLNLARHAFDAGQAACIVLNAANELAVADFLRGQLPFTRIAERVEKALASAPISAISSLEEVLALDAALRKKGL